MKLQKNTSLALFSVLEFAGDPTRHISAAEIATKYGVSSHHLAKVLSELARVGIVESVRGVGGGYRFTGNARRLTLMDVILMFEDFGAPSPDRREPRPAYSRRAGALRGAVRNRRNREGDVQLDHARNDVAPDRATAERRESRKRETRRASSASLSERRSAAREAGQCGPIDDASPSPAEVNPAAVLEVTEQARDDLADTAELVGERLMRRIDFAAVRVAVDEKRREPLVELLNRDRLDDLHQRGQTLAVQRKDVSAECLSSAINAWMAGGSTNSSTSVSAIPDGS